MSLFDQHAPHERGSREWSAFSAVRHDRLGSYRVATPKKHLVTRGPSNIVRIIAPAQQHYLRGAH